MNDFCCRCTGKMAEKYLLFEMFFCRACMNTIENDPDYAFIMKRNNIAVFQCLKKLRQIEN